jgi:hypothetical protein
MKYTPYIPSPGLPVRPGSMQAYVLPSLVNGKRIARRVPMIMGSPVVGAPLARD